MRILVSSCGSAFIIFASSNSFASRGQLSEPELQMALFYNQCVVIPRPKPFGWNGLLQYQSPAGSFIVFGGYCCEHVGQRMW